MAQGNKHFTEISENDVGFVCHMCNQEFIGTSKSVNLRFKMHCKKTHNLVLKKEINFGTPGVAVGQGNIDRNLTRSKMQFSQCRVADLDMQPDLTITR